MIQYGFVEAWQASYFGATARPQARFIAHHLESVEMPLTRPPLADPELQRISDVRQAFIDVRPIPQRATPSLLKLHFRISWQCYNNKANKLGRNLQDEWERTYMARDPQTRKTTRGSAQRNANTSLVASGATTFKLGGVWQPWSEDRVKKRAMDMKRGWRRKKRSYGERGWIFWFTITHVIKPKKPICTL